MRLIFGLISIFLIPITGIAGYAQQPENEGSSQNTTPVIHLDSMPKGFAEDFPLYPYDLIYYKEIKLPDEKTLQEKDKYGRPKVKIVDGVSLGYIRKEKTSIKTKEWFLRNALQAGYRELFSSENLNDDIHEMIYEKTENSTYKKVRVFLSKGRIVVIAWKDRKVEEMPTVSPAVTAEPKEADNTAEKENTGKGAVQKPEPDNGEKDNGSKNPALKKAQ